MEIQTTTDQAEAQAMKCTGLRQVWIRAEMRRELTGDFINLAAYSTQNAIVHLAISADLFPWYRTKNINTPYIPRRGLVLSMHYALLFGSVTSIVNLERILVSQYSTVEIKPRYLPLSLHYCTEVQVKSVSFQPHAQSMPISLPGFHLVFNSSGLAKQLMS